MPRSESPSESSGMGGVSRRRFVATTGAAGLVAGAWLARTAQDEVEPVPSGDRILLRGGCVLSLDPDIGDFDRADVLIEGSRIAAVGPGIETEAEVVEAADMIVMPGFVDTHRHMWQGPLRNMLPNGLLSDYQQEITGTARALFRPEDAYIGDLVTALGALHAGVTTVLDWSHIGNSPAHTDAAIEGLRESGIRAVYAFGSGTSGPGNQFPQDIRRLRERYFSSGDQLLTLAMAAGIDAGQWALAREVGARVTIHANGTDQLLGVAEAMGPDVTCIHCCNLSEEEWRLIADTGASVSIACPIEMEMGHGVPPILQALDHGIRPALSTDVETQMPGDFFTQMRAVFTLGRMLLLARQRDGDPDLPPLPTVREVMEWATLVGARTNGLEDRTGTLTPGKEADVLMLRMTDINVMPVNNAYGAVALGMDTSNVDTVFVRGAVRKWKGQVVGVDMERIRRLVHESRDRIVAGAGWPQTVLGPL